MTTSKDDTRIIRDIMEDIREQRGAISWGEALRYAPAYSYWNDVRHVMPDDALSAEWADVGVCWEIAHEAPEWWGVGRAGACSAEIVACWGVRGQAAEYAAYLDRRDGAPGQDIHREWTLHEDTDPRQHDDAAYTQDDAAGYGDVVDLTLGLPYADA